MLSQKLSQLKVGESNEVPVSNADHASQPVPLATSSPLRTRDITDHFIHASKCLEAGHLVQDEHFYLPEATSALEIMDPKMDSGFGDDGSDEASYEVLQPLEPAQVLGIMDQLLSFEMAWHKGFALYQTLFSSHYIDRLLRRKATKLDEAAFVDEAGENSNGLLHSVLRAFCVSQIKTCDLVSIRIRGEKSYEEEDFVSNFYQRDMLSQISTQEVAQLVHNTVQYVIRHTNMYGQDYAKAILLRLALRALLLDATSPQDFQDRNKALKWAECSEVVDDIKETHSLATPMPKAYSIKVQCRIATTMPPRPIIEIGFDETIASLRSLYQSGQHVYRVFDFYGTGNLLTFVRLFNSHEKCILPFIQCLLQSLIWHKQRLLGQQDYQTFIGHDLAETVIPASNLLEQTKAEAPQSINFQLAKKMDAMTRRVADTYLDVFSTLCMNRARLRRNLFHLIAEWEAIEIEVEDGDVYLQSFIDTDPLRSQQKSDSPPNLYPFSMWARLHKLRLMHWAVALGFELDVYQADEFACMYWYLQHITAHRVQLLESIRDASLARVKVVVQSKRQELEQAIEAQECEIYQAKAVQEFAEGLSLLYSFLGHTGLLPQAYESMPYGQPDMRYYLRMKPFATVSEPAFPSFQDMTGLVTIQMPDEEAGQKMSALDRKAQSFAILDVAEELLKLAKNKWDNISKWDAPKANCINCEDWWRQDVKQVLKSSIQANVTVAMLTNALTKAPDESLIGRAKVQIDAGDKRHHQWWAIPMVLPQRIA